MENALMRFGVVVIITVVGAIASLAVCYVVFDGGGGGLGGVMAGGAIILYAIPGAILALAVGCVVASTMRSPGNNGRDS